MNLIEKIADEKIQDRYSGDVDYWHDAGVQDLAVEVAKRVLREFVVEVERRAEEKMLLTHKLEGSHYAAMKEVAEEWTR